MARKTHPARATKRRLFALWAIALGIICALGLAAARVAVAEEPAASISVYRLYHRSDGQHMFTVDENEVNYLLPRGWKDEGVAFRAYSVSGKPAGENVVGVHRLFNKKTGDHIASADENEVRALTSGDWKDEGVDFYALKSGTDYPVYRLFNPTMKKNGGVGSHLWTLDTNEYDVLSRGEWNGEEIMWYAIGPSEPPLPRTPVDIHGALSVRGTNLVDSTGAVVQLRGMSTHGLAWFPHYVNLSAFQTLRDDWGANCVRLAMYTAETNGYCTGGDQSWIKSLVRQGVDAATNLGMYVIVDWHVLKDESPTVYEPQARTFFDEMSRELKDHVNVIYEICNEPNGWADWRAIKGYAQDIIPTIRKNDPDAIVIVGTPNWSQFVDQAANDPLTGANAKNTLYALHFYASTHTQWLRDRMNAALDAGLPIFISEFGTCDASGNGANNLWEAKQWIDLANRRNVSWMNWSLCNKAESASAIQPWCAKTSGWSTSELTESGNWVRNQMRAAAGL